MLSQPTLPSVVLDTLELVGGEGMRAEEKLVNLVAAGGGHIVLEEKAQDGVNGRTSSLVALDEQPVGCRAKVLVRLPRLRCHLALASRVSGEDDVVMVSGGGDGVHESETHAEHQRQRHCSHLLPPVCLPGDHLHPGRK